MVKELGQEYIDEMKKYYTEREKTIKKHYNNVINSAQEELNNEMNKIEEDKKTLNIDELSM